jgi:hypothetical protein
MLDWPIKTKKVTNLLLDQENTRIPLNGLSQQELIQDLVDNEDVFQIAESIVSNNYFGHENLIAIKSDIKNRFIVLEGNRRLAALKVLLQPDIISGSLLSKFKKLTIDFDPKITEVPVAIAPNRVDAERVIANIHTKDYRRKWKPLREAYFYKKKINEGHSIQELTDLYGGVDVKRWVTMIDMHHMAKSLDLESDLKKVVHNDRIFPITNLERMYDATEVRNFLGINIDSSGKVTGEIIKEEFEKGFKKIVEDVAAGEIDSRSMRNSSRRKKYLKKLPDEYIPDKSEKGFFTADSFSEEQIEFDKEEHESKYQKKKHSRRTPKGLIPAGISFNLDNSSLHDLFKELKKIPVKDCPTAAAILFRSFLQKSLHQYFVEVGVIKDKSVDKKLEQLINLVKSKDSGIEDKAAIEAAVKNKSDLDEIFTTHSMNAITHNRTFSVSENHVRTIWNNYEGLMKIILNPEHKDDE